MNKIQRVLVTGGAGFIGSHVVEYFSREGKEVIVIDDLSRMGLLCQKVAENDLNSIFVRALPNVQFIEESVLDDWGSLLDAANEVDLIVHTAAQTAVTTSVTDPETDFEVNALGTLKVLEAARKSQSRPAVIFCSTNKVYGDRPNRALALTESETRYQTPGDWIGVGEDFGVDHCEHSPYGCSKLAADLYCQDYARLFGLRVGIFRMSCIYGPRQIGVADQGWVSWFAQALLGSQPITICGDGKQVRDVLYVDDLVRAFVLFAENDHPSAVYNIGGGPKHTISLIELISLLEEITALRAVTGFDDWRPSDQKVYVSDISRARESLGWEPQVSPRQGVAALVEALTT